MSVESTREVMQRYFDAEHSDVSMLADDVVFTIMGTGQQNHGPEGVVGMLHYFYHVAFNAVAETKNLVISDGKAVLEADFTGTHTGEFARVQEVANGSRVLVGEFGSRGTTELAFFLEKQDDSWRVRPRDYLAQLSLGP